MFTEQDQLLIWAKRGSSNKRKIFKFKTNKEVKQDFIEIFNNGVNNLMCDESGEEREHVSFESNYKITDQDEKFVIKNFNIDKSIIDAIDNPDVLENFCPKDDTDKTEDNYEIKAILFCGKNNDGYYIAGQKFSPSQVLLKRRRNLLLEKDTFVKEPKKFMIAISDNIDCYYTSKGLFFENYRNANGVFDLSEYYRQASQEEVDNFVNNKFFEVGDSEQIGKMVKGIAMRRKIAKIFDIGSLDDIDKIKENAKKVDVNIKFSQDGTKIELPNDKKELKEVMAFLAEELYPGLFTNSTYLANSNRKIEKS